MLLINVNYFFLKAEDLQVINIAFLWRKIMTAKFSRTSVHQMQICPTHGHFCWLPLHHSHRNGDRNQGWISKVSLLTGNKTQVAVCLTGIWTDLTKQFSLLGLDFWLFFVFVWNCVAYQVFDFESSTPGKPEPEHLETGKYFLMC